MLITYTIAFLSCHVCLYDFPVPHCTTLRHAAQSLDPSTLTTITIEPPPFLPFLTLT